MTMRHDRSVNERLQRIDDCLLLWLESKDREMERVRLEKHMRDYLCVVAHNEKFMFPQTAAIIYKNATEPDFSGKRAAHAFASIAKYASNLLRQPWRQEFHEIKLYCGYYKHEVGELLKDAVKMFEAMGYQHDGRTSMRLPGPVDPDLVLTVCRDSIMAQVECTIMQQIWDDLRTKLSNISWHEIAQFRRDYVGAAEDAGRCIIAFDRERKYLERHGTRSSYFDPHVMHHQMAYTPPMHTCQRYPQIHSPQQVIPPYQQHILKPQDLYPTNGYHHPPLNSYQNGYSHSTPHHHTPAYSIPTTVPTGKLIELDSSPVHQSNLPPSHTYDTSAEFFSSKAKNDGVGAWEDWDLVYKTINRSANHKPSGRDTSDYREPAVESRLSTEMRGMSLARPVTPPNRFENNTGGGTERYRPKKNNSEVEDAPAGRRLRKESVEAGAGDKNYRGRDIQSALTEPSTGDAFVNQRQEVKRSIIPKASTEISTLEIDVVDSSVRQRPVTPQMGGDVPKQQASPQPDTRVSPPKERPEPARPNIITLDVSESFLRDISPRVELPPEKKWQCSYCTYFNEERRNACEMCNKSRCREGIEPYPSGGQECPFCTLVNKKGRNFCSACGKPLKGSPTYV